MQGGVHPWAYPTRIWPPWLCLTSPPPIRFETDSLPPAVLLKCQLACSYRLVRVARAFTH